VQAKESGAITDEELRYLQATMKGIEEKISAKLDHLEHSSLSPTVPTEKKETHFSLPLSRNTFEEPSVLFFETPATPPAHEAPLEMVIISEIESPKDFVKFVRDTSDLVKRCIASEQ